MDRELAGEPLWGTSSPERPRGLYDSFNAVVILNPRSFMAVVLQLASDVFWTVGGAKCDPVSLIRSDVCVFVCFFSKQTSFVSSLFS